MGNRKLLLNRKEIEKITIKSTIKGDTIIPTRLFIDNNGRAKLEIALAKGKKIYDKREDIKAKEEQIRRETIEKERSKKDKLRTEELEIEN